MFTSPQSKCFLNQEHVKNRVLNEQYSIVLLLQQKLDDINKMLSKVISNIEKEEKVKKKLKSMSITLQEVISKAQESKARFQEEIVQRDQTKQKEQIFFKNTMMLYQQKIKELNRHLLSVQQMIQNLQQKGYLPYIQSFNKNNIIPSLKSNTYDLIKKKMELLNGLDKIYGVKMPEVSITCQELIGLILGVQQFKWQKIKFNKYFVRSEMERTQEANRILKETIKDQKRQMQFIEIRQKLERGERVLREDLLDYVHEINNSLIKSLSRRDITGIFEKQLIKDRSRSCQSKLCKIHYDWEEEEVKLCLKEIGNQLTDSFLDQCSYLISDRFIVDEEEVSV